MKIRPVASSTSRTSPDHTMESSMSGSLEPFSKNVACESSNSRSKSGRKATAPSQVQSNSTACPISNSNTVPDSDSETTLTLRHRNRFHFAESRYSRRIAFRASSSWPASADGRFRSIGKRACVKSSLSSSSVFESSTELLPIAVTFC